MLFWDVKLLVESLGGYAQYRQVFPGELAIEGQKYYQMTVTINDNPFKIKNKSKKWKKPTRGFDKQKIVSIVEIPIEPMRCLTVSASDSLYCCGNKFTVTANTATGINAIMGASTQRLEMIARIICESGVVPFYRHLIKMNQMFQDDELTIRVTGGQTIITPDDLKGEINVVVNAGIGTGDKQQKIQQLMQLIQLYPQMIQGKIAGPQHAAYAMSKIIEEFGWKNTNNFLFTPEEVMQQLQQEQPAKPEEKVSVSVSYKDLPPDGKMQLMQQLGIQLDPQMVMMMEVLNGAGKTKGTAPNVGEGSPRGNDTGVSGQLPPTREEQAI